MRAIGPEMHPHKQRRRRYVAAVLCLGSLAAVAFGTFVAERQAARGQGATTADVAGAAGVAPSPQPLSSQPAAYPLGGSGGLGNAQRGLMQPSSSSTAGPSSVSPAPDVLGPAGVDITGTGNGNGSGSGTAGSSSSDGTSGSQYLANMAAASPSPPMKVSDPLTATTFAGLPQVGAFFNYSTGTASTANGHFCSGSVVNSEPGDIVITAAHCVYDSSSGTYLNDIAFVPGYHDGQQPYGVWTPSKILVPQQWIDSGDPDYDVAFVVVHQPGSSERIEDQVGADQLGVTPSYTGLAEVVGYPATTEQPITCTNYTKELGPTQLEFDCPGFPDGTSGGPFLASVDPQTGEGTVIGVIGGYQTGGDTPDISYSVYFGSAVADLFNQAQSAAKAES